MKYGRLTLGQVEALGNMLGGEEGIAGLFRGELEVHIKMVNFITHVFKVFVNEILPIEEAIKLGKFGRVDDLNTSQNFPQIKDGKNAEKQVFIFHFAKRMSTEKAIELMGKAGYKPATVWDLLGLAEKKPNLYREFPIVALSSYCTADTGDSISRCAVGICCSGDSKKELALGRTDSEWNEDMHFLAVRK